MGRTRKSSEGFVTKSGEVLSEADVERLAGEAEAGYAPDQLRVRWRRGRPPMGSGPAKLVAVRLDPELEAAVRAHATDEDMSTSEVIRVALRRYLAAG